MYQCAIFDVDGTLIDTEQAVIGSLQRVLKEELSKDFPADELSFVLGIPGAAALSQLGIKNVEDANRKWNIYFKDYTQYIRVFPQIETTLKKLKELNVKTGIVTSKTREELDNDFVPFALTDFIDIVVCADDTTRHKPHPEPILKFLQDAKLRPSEALYIGDTHYDSQCARDAGVVFGLALWGARSPDTILCDYKFNNPQEIVPLFIK
ncbi:MAG: HAD family hydrolase [Clostridia bacterium]|nr:HAD family hydrolase [Clostridia bacterium]